MTKSINKLGRRLRRLRKLRLSRKQKRRVLLAVQVGLVTSVALIAFVRVREGNSLRHLHYAPLLNTIAKGESNGNYNAYYGKPDNTEVVFTAMSIEQVLAWQHDYAAQGHPSNAVGKYQFMPGTLNGLVQRLKIDKSARFDAAMQDRLAIALLERRGLREYAKGKLTREEFAHNLSREWAALPRVLGPSPAASYYDGDGLNQVRVSQADVIRSIDALHSGAAR